MLLLLLPGGLGLSWGHLRQRTVEKQMALATQAVAEAPSADQYLSLYDEWSRLSPVQKADNPWGQGRYGGPDIQKSLSQHQYERFMADLSDLNSGVKSYPQQLADVLYGSDWAQRLEQFQRQQETRNLVIIGSVVCLSAGGLLAAAGLLKAAFALMLRKREPQPEPEALRQKSPSVAKTASAPLQSVPSKPAECSLDIRNNDEPKDENPLPDPEPATGSGYFGSCSGQPIRTKSASPLPPLVSSSVSAERDKTPASGEMYFGWAMDTQEESAVATSLMTTEPVSRGLSELTEEVSAIRQYAAAQQDQMRKLQDGYDWMIIRRFCMRIIRCIDNIEDRIGKLGKQEEDLSACLEDIRDELVFALESSGIEQYQPDLNVSFKGLEKYAEAVRQRIPAPTAEMAGTIAEVIRPGYQYLVSDEDVKIVRCAQVKLYDTAETES